MFAIYSPMLFRVDQQKQTLLIAASLIAAIRLRGEPITPSPKVKYIINQLTPKAVNPSNLALPSHPSHSNPN